VSGSAESTPKRKLRSMRVPNAARTSGSDSEGGEADRPRRERCGRRRREPLPAPGGCPSRDRAARPRMRRCRRCRPPAHAKPEADAAAPQTPRLLSKTKSKSGMGLDGLGLPTICQVPFSGFQAASAGAAVTGRDVRRRRGCQSAGK
jgi:hypothetical protein